MVAILLTSFALVIDRAQLVAPDRVEIMEIDLNAVKVSVDETRLYNTSAPSEPEQQEEPPQKVEEVPPAPAPVPMDTPSMVDPIANDNPATEVEKPTPKADAKPDDIPAPRKKTVVRVNRETVSLDRTLTISVVDALRVAMTRCWAIDTTRPGLENIRAVAHLTMRQNGTVRDVWFEGAAAAETDPTLAYVLDTIRTAIDVCQPFSMLPVNEFAKWEKIQLTFYPTQGKVM